MSSNRSWPWLRGLFSLAFAATALGGATAAHAKGLEGSGQSVAALTSDRETRGGGLGLGIALSAALPNDWLERGAHLVLRGRGIAVVGAGLVWGVDAAVLWRMRQRGSYTPEFGIFAGTMGGALIRAIDAQGRLAMNPFAAGLALSPLRFELEQGSIAFLSTHFGPTLFRDGSPPFMLTLSLFEVTQTFGG